MKLMSNPQLQVLVQRYEHLEKRDRFALNGLISFIAILLLYVLVWVPANNFLADRKLNHERQLSLLQYLRSTEQQARASAGKKGSSVSSNKPLLQTVSNLAGLAGIQPDRLQPEATDGVSVWFDDVAFNNLIRWMELLNQEGITVRQVSIDREEASGTVNARVILRI